MKGLKIFLTSEETIVLKDGEEKTFEFGGQTDEGYSYTNITVRRVGDIITRHKETRSCDCDGPLATYTEEQTSIHDINDDGRGRWERIEERQRDYFAEQMNY